MEFIKGALLVGRVGLTERESIINPFKRFFLSIYPCSTVATLLLLFAGLSLSTELACLPQVELQMASRAEEDEEEETRAGKRKEGEAGERLTSTKIDGFYVRVLTSKTSAYFLKSRLW